MKIQNLCILPLLLILSCGKDDSTSTPTITSSFSCKIDGVSFSSNSPSTTTLSDITTIGAASGNETVQLVTEKSKVGEISLSQFYQGQYSKNLVLYSTATSPASGGKVVITVNDANSIQGTFNFEAANSNGVKVNITEGKFTVKK